MVFTENDHLDWHGARISKMDNSYSKRTAIYGVVICFNDTGARLYGNLAFPWRVTLAMTNDWTVYVQRFFFSPKSDGLNKVHPIFSQPSENSIQRKS